MLFRNMLFSALLLALFAVFGSGLVAMTHQATAERIQRNEREALLESINTLVPRSNYDNDLFRDHIQVTDPQLLGTKDPVDVYRAREEHHPVALVLTPIAPGGYGGDIKLLVAIRYNGSIAGVRVMSHHETPGLGDRVEIEKSDWVTKFNGHSLGDPAPDKWKVKKDGGIFDQFTGATITPRAVVKGVYNTLRYFKAHRDELFTRQAPSDDEHEKAHLDEQGGKRGSAKKEAVHG
mgnify:CR=1 FL=1